jgi:hypothetical protein
MIVDYMPIFWVRQDRHIFEKTSAYFSIYFNIINPYAINKKYVDVFTGLCYIKEARKEAFFLCLKNGFNRRAGSN